MMEDSAAKRTAGKFVEYVFVRSFDFYLRLFPFRLRAWLTERLGLFLHVISKRYRNLIGNHLRQAFPDKDQAWIDATVRGNFKHMGRLLAEFNQTPRINDRFFKRWFVFKPDTEEHRNIFKNGGIAILGHLGNWEWHGVAGARAAGRDVYALVKRHTNYWSNAYLERSRTVQGVQLIYVDQNAIISAKKARRGEFVAFTSDQDARNHGEFVDFLGKPASTFMGPAVVARNTTCPIYFVWSYRDDQGRLVFEHEELKRPDRDPTDFEAWEMEFTKLWTAKLEEKIRLHPTDYLWAHNRWKTQP